MNIAGAQTAVKENDHNHKIGQFVCSCDIIRNIKSTINISLSLIIISLCSCTISPSKECIGINELPVEFASAFEETVDDPLLNRAIGENHKGGLCQGKVYISKENVMVPIYRAWTSTNPNSRLGKWWVFNSPDGKIAQYRSDYEICYGFSPLDKLTYCNLKANTKVVIGTGQSVKCDDHLAYPSSAAKQLYIEIDTNSPSVTDCKDFDGIFSWKPTPNCTQ